MQLITRLFAIGLLACGIAFPQMASAQTGESCSKPNPEVLAMKKLPDFVSKVTNPGTGSMLQTFTSAGKNIGSRLVPAAKGLAGALLLISFLAAAVKALVNNSPLRNELIDTVVNGMILAAVLSQYGTFAQMGVSLAETLNGVVGGDLASALTKFFLNFFTMLGAAYESFTVGISCIGFFSWNLGMIAETILGLIVLVGALLITIFAFAEMLYVTLLGPVLIAIAIAFGPIAIATLASKATRPFFGQWLSFLASAAAVQFIVFVILELMGTVMLNATSQIRPGTGNSFLVHALTIALIALMMSKIFAQVPQIASGIAGGKLGVSGDSNAGSTLTAGVGAGAVTSAMSGGVKSAFNRGASAGAGARQGAANALQAGRN